MAGIRGAKKVGVCKSLAPAFGGPGFLRYICPQRESVKTEEMKTNRFAVLAIAVAMLLSGCTDRQVQGTMAGGTLGAIFGSSIGGLMGGPRGSDAGTALGMAVGAVVGNAVTSPKNTVSDGDVGGYDDSGYSRPRSERDVRRSSGDYGGGQPSHIDGLKVVNIRFVDENRNQAIDAGERAKILFEIHNDGAQTLYNITPVIDCDQAKRIAVSPTAIIADLAPGKAVAYTANILASPKLKSGEAAFRIAFQDGSRIVTFKEFTLATRAAAK